LSHGFQSVPDTFHPVGYPAFLAAIYRLTGRSFGAVAIVQSLLGGATCLLVWSLTKQMAGSDTRALAAETAVAFYPPFIYYGSMLLTESIAPFCLTLAVWLLLRTLRRPTGIGAAATGTALAVATLVRPNFLLFYPFVVLLAWWVDRRDVGKGMRAAGQILACSVPLLALVAANNSLLTGRLTGLSTNGGVNFFLMQADVQGLTFYDEWLRPVRNARYSTMVSSPVPFTDEPYFYKRGARELLARRDKVGHAVSNLAEGFGLGLQGYWPANEPLSAEPSDAADRWGRRILSLCSQGFFWVLVLPTVLGAAWAGLRRPRLRRLEIQSVLAASIVIVLVVTFVVFLADPRVHVPFDPILIACLAMTFAKKSA